MFRIQNAHELSKRDRARIRASDERFASRLARELARLGRASGMELRRIESIAALPAKLRYAVVPVTKRARLWHGRGGKAKGFAALDIPASVFERVVLSERAYLRSLWRVAQAWPVRPERLDLWKRSHV